MEDMDIDFDIGSDSLQQFLQHKLKEIQMNNEELEQQVNRRRALVTTCLEKAATELNQDILRITSTWHRKRNGKWIIGFEISNVLSIGVAKDLKVILQWDLPISFVYQTKIFERYKPVQHNDSQLPKVVKSVLSTMEKKKADDVNILIQNEWVQTTEITNSATVLIVFRIPELIDKRNFSVTGILLYDYKTKSSQVNIPPIEVAISELASSENEIKNFEVVTGNDQAYLSLLCTSKHNCLVAKLFKSDQPLEYLFEFECLFKKINITSKNKMFFLVDEICEDVNGSLIILEKYKDLYNFDIYSRESSINLLLHYIYGHVPNLLVIPKKYQHILEENTTNSAQPSLQAVSFCVLQDKLKMLGKAMESQVHLVDKFCNKEIRDISQETVISTETIDLNINPAKYQRFRHKLSDLEHQADLLYNSICKETGTAKLLNEDKPENDI